MSGDTAVNMGRGSSLPRDYTAPLPTPVWSSLANINIIVIMEVDIVHFYELKWNFDRALKNYDVYEEYNTLSIY